MSSKNIINTFANYYEFVSNFRFSDDVKKALNKFYNREKEAGNLDIPPNSSPWFPRGNAKSGLTYVLVCMIRYKRIQEMMDTKDP